MDQVSPKTQGPEITHEYFPMLFRTIQTHGPLVCRQTYVNSNTVKLTNSWPPSLLLLWIILTLVLLDLCHDISVGTTPRYRFDGPGIQSRWWRSFPQPSIPAMGPTQPTLQWVRGLLRR
jgi:hypothetical protein